MEHLSGEYYSATVCQNRAAKSKRGRAGEGQDNNHNEFSGVMEILWNWIVVTAQPCKYIKTHKKNSKGRIYGIWIMFYKKKNRKNSQRPDKIS